MREIKATFDPKNIFSFLLSSGDRFVHFLADLLGVRSAGAKHDWEIVVHELDCAHKMNDPFLARDPADKKQIRCSWIDSVTQESIDVINTPIFFEIDSVMNYVDAF